MTGTLTSLVGLSGDLEQLTVYIEIKFQGVAQPYFGSGMLIDGTHVLTSAHVIDTYEDGLVGAQTIDYIRVYPNYDHTGGSGYYTVSSTDLFAGYNPTQSVSAKEPYDLGIATLSSSVGYDDDAFIGLSAFYSDDAADGRYTSLRGYPTSLYDVDPHDSVDDDGLTNIVYGDMYLTSGTSSASSGIATITDSLMRGGQSGSAMVTNFHNLTSDQVGDDLYHSFIMGVAGYRAASTEGEGLYLTPDQLDWIMDTIYDVGADPNDLPYNYIFGSSSADSIDGTYRRDVITTVAGADTISGEGGNDIVEGLGASGDFDGGDGMDTLSFLVNGSGLTIDVGAGTASSSRTFENVENVIATTHDDIISLTSQTNFVAAGAGDDTVDVYTNYSLETWDPAVLLGDGNDVLTIHPDEDPNYSESYSIYTGTAVVLDPSDDDTLINGFDSAEIFSWLGSATDHDASSTLETWEITHQDLIFEAGEGGPAYYYTQPDKMLSVNKFSDGGIDLVGILYQWWDWADDPGQEGYQNVTDSGWIGVVMPQFESGDFGLETSIDSLTIDPGDLQGAFIALLDYWGGEDSPMSEFAHSEINWDGLI